MSVYTELLRVGVQDAIAHEIADAVHRTATVVTIDVLDARIAHMDARIAHMEARLVRTIHTSLIAMTGIFAGFVAAMAWVVSP